MEAGLSSETSCFIKEFDTGESPKKIVISYTIVKALHSWTIIYVQKYVDQYPVCCLL